MANRKTRVSTLQAGFCFCYEKRTRTEMPRNVPAATRRQNAARGKTMKKIKRTRALKGERQSAN